MFFLHLFFILHMKMHLFNILNQLEATEEEKQTVAKFFVDKVPHHKDIVNKLWLGGHNDFWDVRQSGEMTHEVVE